MRVTPAIMSFLAVCALACAQQSVETGPRSDARSASARHLTLNGCVAGTGERYTFMQTKTLNSFLLQGDHVQLEDARGKLVELTGRELPPPGGEGMSARPRLEVSQLRVLADRCPIQTAVRQRSDVQGSQTPEKPSTAATPDYRRPGAQQTPPRVGNNPTTWGNGAQGAPSPGTGNAPPPTPTPPR
jgi:hypothetical protein